MTKIYLSGNMTPNSDAYEDWTHEFSNSIKCLYGSKDYICSFSVLDNDPKFIVHHDLARLKKCDILVINLGVLHDDYHLTGSIIEIYEAYKQNKPVYAFTSENLIRSKQANSPWIQQFITKEFDNIKKLLEYLRCDEDI